MFKKSILVFLLFAGKVSLADSRYYRLTLREDPSSTAVVGWDTSKGDPINHKVYLGEEDLGQNPLKYPQVFSPSKVYDHKGMMNTFVRLKGLKPNTKYYFVIADLVETQHVSQRMWFQTISDNPNDRLSIVAGGDSRNNREVRRNANLLVAKLRPHVVLFGGDYTDDGSIQEWKDWFEDWQQSISSDGRLTHLVGARGNHEMRDKDVVELLDTPDDVHYALTFGGTLLRVYTLNSLVPKGLTSRQNAWFKKDLKQNAHKVKWRFAQYHFPLRPHVKKKLTPIVSYQYWAPKFFEYQFQLAIESDAHTVKTTWPLRPSYEAGSDEGFIRDSAGTVFLGEGCWGAPLRNADDNKSWTRDSGKFNHFNWIFLDQDSAEIRTVKVDSAQSVASLSDENRFELPAGIDIWKPLNGDVIEIFSRNYSLLHKKETRYSQIQKTKKRVY